MADFDDVSLDDLDVDELRAFWSKYHRASKTQAVALLGPRKKVTQIVWTLAAMALDLSIAKRARLDGKIPLALHYEDSAERRYKQLPADVRW